MGQYELCGQVLDIAQDLGCRFILTLGGLKREEVVKTPKLYCAASDPQTLREALQYDLEVIGGHIFGVAGLLIGLGSLRGMRGLCILAETLGYPDALAAREVLRIVCQMLHLKVSLERLDAAVEATKGILKSFGVSVESEEDKARFRGLI